MFCSLVVSDIAYISCIAGYQLTQERLLRPTLEDSATAQSLDLATQLGGVHLVFSMLGTEVPCS